MLIALACPAECSLSISCKRKSTKGWRTTTCVSERCTPSTSNISKQIKRECRCRLKLTSSCSSLWKEWRSYLVLSNPLHSIIPRIEFDYGASRSYKPTLCFIFFLATSYPQICLREMEDNLFTGSNSNFTYFSWNQSILPNFWIIHSAEFGNYDPYAIASILITYSLSCLRHTCTIQ